MLTDVCLRDPDPRTTATERILKRALKGSFLSAREQTDAILNAGRHDRTAVQRDAERANKWATVMAKKNPHGCGYQVVGLKVQVLLRRHCKLGDPTVVARIQHVLTSWADVDHLHTSEQEVASKSTQRPGDPVPPSKERTRSARGRETTEQTAAIPQAVSLGFLSPADLAKEHHLELDPLRKRLERWRRSHADGWIENTEPKSTEARFLYSPTSVANVIEKAKEASSKASSKRPA
jgi:hypothetical protein